MSLSDIIEELIMWRDGKDFLSNNNILWNIPNFPDIVLFIESIKTPSMEDVSKRVLEKIKNI